MKISAVLLGCLKASPVDQSQATSPPLMIKGPAENETVDISGFGEITFSAFSDNGDIVSFDQTSPANPIDGMYCMSTWNDKQNCFIVPTADQYGEIIEYCFNAVDSVGIVSDTRCFWLNFLSPTLPID